MAKTTTSVAMGVTVTIVVVFAVAMFITTIVFFAQSQRAQQDLAEARANATEIIRETEQDASPVQNALVEAREARSSLVDYLLRQRSEALQLAVGASGITVEQAREQAAERGGVETGSLLGRVQALESQIGALERSLREAEQARRNAEADARAEAERVAAIESESSAQIEAAQGLVDRFAGDVRRFQTETQGTIQNIERRADTRRSQFEDREGELEGRISGLVAENLQLRDVIDRLRNTGERGAQLEPRDEATLVDGTVAGVDPITGEVIISLGQRDKLVLGIRFAVYSGPGELNPDPETGELATGKAIIEVVRIDPTSARCRVIEAQRGNPPVTGDVIANAVYDPDKIYRFVIAGQFDSDGDGSFTAFERDDLRALIERWGGVVDDALAGNTDFVVLGREPVLPPAPRSDAPVEVFQLFVQAQQDRDRYNAVLERASQIRIPVLNENRLRTLIGDLSLN